MTFQDLGFYVLGLSKNPNAASVAITIEQTPMAIASESTASAKK